MELRAAFKPMDDGSVAILRVKKIGKALARHMRRIGNHGLEKVCAHVKSKLLASELIAVQTPETTHGGRIGSFISML
jgi:hypothetical protein